MTLALRSGSSSTTLFVRMHETARYVDHRAKAERLRVEAFRAGGEHGLPLVLLSQEDVARGTELDPAAPRLHDENETLVLDERDVAFLIRALQAAHRAMTGDGRRTP